jgi:hypothetical protein
LPQKRSTTKCKSAVVLREIPLMANVNTQTLLIVFVACTGAAVLLQACVLLALYLTIRNVAKTVQEELHEVRTTVLPVVTDTKDFLTRVGPKIDAVTTDLAALVHGLREEGAELQASTAEILGRVRRQTSRVDTMLTGILDTVDRAGAIVTDAINVPLRQI